MPCLGQCLNQGTGWNEKDSQILWNYRAYRSLSIGTWHASSRKLMCARQAAGEVEVRALDPSSPQAVTDQASPHLIRRFFGRQKQRLDRHVPHHSRAEATVDLHRDNLAFGFCHYL
jgi:hypothetical protein